MIRNLFMGKGGFNIHENQKGELLALKIKASNIIRKSKKRKDQTLVMIVVELLRDSYSEDEILACLSLTNSNKLDVLLDLTLEHLPFRGISVVSDFGEKSKTSE